jgi:hypothetical protein
MTECLSLKVQGGLVCDWFPRLVERYSTVTRSVGAFYEQEGMLVFVTNQPDVSKLVPIHDTVEREWLACALSLKGACLNTCDRQGQRPIALCSFGDGRIFGFSFDQVTDGAQLDASVAFLPLAERFDLALGSYQSGDTTAARWVGIPAAGLYALCVPSPVDG